MKKRRIKLKNTPKVRQYNQVLKKRTKIQHVVHYNGSWAVKRAGADKVTKIFDRQDQAIKQAVIIAKSYGTPVIIHGRDGKIREIKHP